MNSRTFMLRETFFLLLGELLCSAAVVGIYALLGKLEPGVIWGVLIGTILGVGNFFMLGVSADAAASKAQEQDVKGGKGMVKSSYAIRTIVMFVVLALCAKSGHCNVIALAVPLLVVQPTLLVAEFFRKKGE